VRIRLYHCRHRASLQVVLNLCETMMPETRGTERRHLSLGLSLSLSREAIHEIGRSCYP
jgi:hypothetical protein